MRAIAIIEGVLRDHPETRSSDRELYILVWEQYGFRMSAGQKAQFRELPSSETIRRVRQKLQEQGHYAATERVKQHRIFKSMEVQQKIPQTQPEKVETLIDTIFPDAVRVAKKIVEPEQTSLI